MDLKARVSTLIAVRVVVSTLLLGSAALILINRPGAFPVDPFFFLIGATYGFSVLYLATLRFVERRPWLVDLQFGVDALIVSGFIQVTGGLTSVFSSLYVLPIIAASTIRFRRGAMQVALLTAILYLGIVMDHYINLFWFLPASWQPDVTAALPSLRFAQFTVAINLFGFAAVALLAGSLAEGVRSAGARLADVSHEIEDLRAFNAHVVDSLLSGLVTTDAGGRVLTFNRGATLITGLAAKDAVGRDVSDVLQLPLEFRAGLGALEGTRSARADVELRAGDGRTLELGVTASALTLPKRRHGYLLTFQDVTDMRRLERDARLQQRLAAVGEMAAGIAHEIRNPLASMSGSIQVLRQELPLSDEQAQLMDIVLRESERLNDTIRSFLAYARPQRQAATQLDMRSVVQDAALLLRNSAEVRDGHIVDVDVPARPVWVEADEGQIRQIVWNLATNGLRAMRRGGHLRMAVSGDGEEVVLSVQDEGCGIPAADLDAIFQPFHSTFEKGTGLGLSIVHRIVSDYDGAIQVASTVGAGTTVRVRLPIQAAVAVAR
jgi:two-component system sensor histidine kinase PilS (NtrC family)